MPHDLPPWQTVYYDHRLWRLSGLWERLHTVLRELVRLRLGRDATPSAAILDSQTVRTTEAGGPRGYDGAKKTSGRKRHLLVDTLGLVLHVKVHTADLQDRAGARLLFEANLREAYPRMNLVWADAGYTGELGNVLKSTLGWKLEIVKHAWKGVQSTWLPVGTTPPVVEVPAGFVVLPKRWIVERTFAWIGKSRRLSKDYEALPETTENLVYQVMIRIMLRRLARA